jgi:phage-related minor tail protein
MSSSSSTSTTTREYSKKVHERIKTLRVEAKEKRSVAQQAYQQFKVNFRVMKRRATDLKKQQNSYTMSLEEFKSALDMFQMKAQELQNRMKST